mmetsp:Transcript_42806/g.84372  ORF Transcript_42806/g.84372 Transcript_42806/m.84372 type:complete len:223 (+) Transcript_42806:59-727(+)
MNALDPFSSRSRSRPASKRRRLDSPTAFVASASAAGAVGSVLGVSPDLPAFSPLPPLSLTSSSLSPPSLSSSSSSFTSRRFHHALKSGHACHGRSAIFRSAKNSTYASSLGSSKSRERPFLPARPARPTRCTNAAGSCGASNCTIQSTSGTSRPLAATSVHSSTAPPSSCWLCGACGWAGESEPEPVVAASSPLLSRLPPALDCALLNLANTPDLFFCTIRP